MKKIYEAGVQFLVVSYAKSLGLDPRGQVIRFDPMECGRQAQGLRPLLVYAVVEPSYSRYERLAVDACSPASISLFLSQAWSAKAGLGMPRRLEVKPALKAGLTGVEAWLAQQGVTLEVTSSIRGIDAFERTSVDIEFGVTWPDEFTGRIIVDLPRDLTSCNAGLQAYDRFRFSVGGWRSEAEGDEIKAWQASDKRFCHHAPVENDWNPKVVVERAVKGPVRGILVKHGEAGPISIAGMKETVAMWPGGPGAFFRQTGVAKRDFDLWVGGRAHLDSSGFAAIQGVACVQYQDDYDDWELGGGGLYDASGASKRTITTLYDVFSHGGDLRFSFEIVGSGGQLGPMRCLAFASCGGLMNIFLLDRSAGTDALLKTRNLINLEEAEEASPEVWETVLSIIEHRAEFKSPGKVGAALEAKHQLWFAQRERW